MSNHKNINQSFIGWAWYNHALLLLAALLFLSVFTTHAQIHYVSKSGSNTPPYTSWETAADSIQKVINICTPGDTIIVGAGTYYESITAAIPLTFIGLGTDSTVINGNGINRVTIEFEAYCSMSGFHIIGSGDHWDGTIILASFNDMNVSDCLLEDSNRGLWIGRSGNFRNLVFRNVHIAVQSHGTLPGVQQNIENCVMMIQYKNGELNGIRGTLYGTITLKNSIIILRDLITYGGQGITFSHPDRLIAKNNIIAAHTSISWVPPSYGVGMWDCISRVPRAYPDSPSIVENNYFSNNAMGKLEGNAMKLLNEITRYRISNNIITRCSIGVYTPVAVVMQGLSYNMFWNNSNNTNGFLTYGPGDTTANPMVVGKVEDTTNLITPYQLQLFSPAIDAGDPALADPDGSRSDIGPFGGPGGMVYSYPDLPPAFPSDLKQTITNKILTLTWQWNSESDFSHYQIYRDTVLNFIPGPQNRYRVADTSVFIDSLTAYTPGVYYLGITALDRQGNESELSDKIIIQIMGTEEAAISQPMEYRLYQNYPNPFNPGTGISYSLREGGWVNLTLYTLTGEKLQTLQEGYQSAGNYTVTADLGHLASGIYLYRIEVHNGNRIPVFRNMKKLVLVK